MNAPALTIGDTEPFNEQNLYLVEHDDGVHIRASGASLVASCIEDCRDFERKQLPHCDAIQLIPAGSAREWFAAGLMQEVSIRGCEVFADDSKLQGITGFDGLFRHIEITGCTISTQSEWEIAFNGLLSGTISGNVRTNGEPCHVSLFPLRIGGKLLLQDPAIWVIGFDKKSGLVYEPITLGAETITDNRQRIFNDNDIFLNDFDIQGFWQKAPKAVDRDIAAHMRNIKKLALEHGRLAQSKTDKPMFDNKRMILGVIRHLLTIAGGWIVAEGWLTDEAFQQLVGAAMTVAGVAWSIIDKKENPVADHYIEPMPQDMRGNVPPEYSEPNTNNTKAESRRSTRSITPTVGLTKGYFLGERSRLNLEGVHPDLVRVIELGIASSPHDFTVIEGVRSRERQEQLFRSKPKRTWTMNSKHLVQPDGYSHAVDLAVFEVVDGKQQLVDDLQPYREINLHLQQVAQEAGVYDLEWGGDWQQRDGMHWQVNR